MNVIVTVNDKDYVLGIKEAKRFCDGIVYTGDNVLHADGKDIKLDNETAKKLHRQIHGQLYV